MDVYAFGFVMWVSGFIIRGVFDKVFEQEIKMDKLCNNDCAAFRESKSCGMEKYKTETGCSYKKALENCEWAAWTALRLRKN